MSLPHIFIKPREGYLVRDPALSDVLPAEGRLVADSAYWRRRIGDKDVELVPADRQAEAIKAAEAAEAARHDEAAAAREAEARKLKEANVPAVPAAPKKGS